MIVGVEFKEIISHTDERGFFRELINPFDHIIGENIGQISHSLVYPGVTKAWHAHKTQTQWNYVVNGLIYVALYDYRKNSSTFGKTITFLAGDNQKNIIYKFPYGVLHGYKCIHGPMNIIYITSGQYDLNEEIKIPYNDKAIGFDWINVVKIK